MLVRIFIPVRIETGDVLTVVWWWNYQIALITRIIIFIKNFIKKILSKKSSKIWILCFQSFYLRSFRPKFCKFKNNKVDFFLKNSPYLWLSWWMTNFELSPMILRSGTHRADPTFLFVEPWIRVYSVIKGIIWWWKILMIPSWVLEVPILNLRRPLFKTSKISKISHPRNFPI